MHPANVAHLSDISCQLNTLTSNTRRNARVVSCGLSNLPRSTRSLKASLSSAQNYANSRKVQLSACAAGLSPAPQASLQRRRQQQRPPSGVVGRGFLLRPVSAVASEAAAVPEPESQQSSAPTLQETVAKLTAFILPAMLSTLIGPILSMIDTAFVGQSSLVQLAALGPATLISDVTAWVFSWLGVGTISFIAQATAKGDQKEAEQLTRTAMALGLACGVGVCIWHLLGATSLLTALRTAPEVLDPARTYVVIRALGFPVALLNTAMWGVCMGHQDPHTPLLVNLLSCALNVAGDFWLCSVMGLGIAGAAWATVASIYVSFLAYPLSIYLRKKNYLSNLKGPIEVASVKRYFGFALPVMFVTAATLSVYAVMAVVANMHGILTTASHKVAGGVFQFFAFCGEPMFQAAQALMPVDSAEARQVFTRAVSLVGVVVGAVAGALACFTLLHGGAIFTQDPGVLSALPTTLYPLFFSLMLLIPSRSLQGLVVAKSDLLFYAAITAVDAVLFAAVVAYVNMHTSAGYICMWWVHVALYVLNVAQFSLRVCYTQNR